MSPVTWARAAMALARLAPAAPTVAPATFLRSALRLIDIRHLLGHRLRNRGERSRALHRLPRPGLLLNDQFEDIARTVFTSSLYGLIVAWIGTMRSTCRLRCFLIFS